MSRSAAAGSGSGGYRWAILALLTSAQLAMSIAAYSWGPLAPFLRDEFGATRGQVGSLVSALFFASAVVSIPSGLAVDRWGARVMLVIALASMGIAFSAISLAGALSSLFIMAALSGIGYGMINQVSTKGLMIWFSSDSRAMAMGIKQTGVTLGGALGAAVIPAISLAMGWRWAVVFAGILMLVMVVVVSLWYRERPAGERSLDFGRPAGTWTGRGKISWGPAARRNLPVLCAVGVLLAFSQTSITSFLVLYLQEELDFTLGAAGAGLTVLMAAGAAGRVAWGLISDRFFRGNRQKPMVILCLTASTGALATAFLDTESARWLVYSLSALLGFTFMGWNAVFLTYCAEIAGSEMAGSATGLMLAMVSAGVVIGPPVFGFTADKAGYFWGWLILSAFGLAGAISFVWSVMRQPLANKKSDT